jgi:integrase
MIRKATIEWNLWKQPFNPAAVIATGKKPAPRKRYVMEQEFPTLIREIEREPVFIRLYFYLVMFTGPRPGEVEHAKQAHFHVMPDGSVLWHKPITKTDEHYIMLPYCLPELIRRHMAVLQPSQWLFPGRKGQCLSKEFWNARWVEIRDRCKMHDVQLRDLRRTCATDLLNDEENPMDLISLSKGVLNHSNLNTTTVYARPKMEKVGRHLDARMRKVLGKAGVRYDG